MKDPIIHVFNTQVDVPIMCRLLERLDREKIMNITRNSIFTVYSPYVKDDGYSNIVVSRTIQKDHMTDRDSRFYTELVYGTIRYLNYLDLDH